MVEVSDIVLESMLAQAKDQMLRLKELHESMNGPELNEDGDPFVEIREDVESSVVEAVEPTQTSPASNEWLPNDDFDQKLLEMISRLELEEDGGRKSVRFVDHPTNAILDSARSSPASVLKHSDHDPSTISEDVLGNTQLNATQSADKSDVGEPSLLTETFVSPMSLEVIEKEFSDDDFSDSSEDQLQDDIQAKEVQVAYHRKRQQFISAGLLSTK
jgi:hypothetical protein